MVVKRIEVRKLFNFSPATSNLITIAGTCLVISEVTKSHPKDDDDIQCSID